MNELREIQRQLRELGMDQVVSPEECCLIDGKVCFGEAALRRLAACAPDPERGRAFMEWMDAEVFPSLRKEQ